MDDALKTTTGLDIVVLDACLMGQPEVAYQIRNCCQYVVASEAETLLMGIPYQVGLQGLAANADLGARQICTDLVKGYGDFFTEFNVQESSNLSVTLSAVETSKLTPLASAFKTYASVLESKDAEYHEKIAAGLQDTLNFKDANDPKFMTSTADICDLATKIAEATGDAQLKAAGEAVIAATEAAVTAKVGLVGFANSCGLDCYFPRTRAVDSGDSYAENRASYLEQDWAIDTGWATWLDKYWVYTS